MKLTSPLVLQIAILTFFTMLFAAPLTLKGTNVVTKTFALGAKSIFEIATPFGTSAPGADTFKYSPAFAIFYKPFTLLPESLHAVLWVFLNSLVFCWGLSLWVLFREKQQRKFFYYIAWALTLIELNGALIYQQQNALLTGFMLAGLKAFATGHFALAGLLLAIPTNFKVFPILIAAALFIPINKKYLGYFLFFSFLLLLFPSLFIGFSQNLKIHIEWFKILFDNATGSGILDLARTLDRYGYTELGFNLRKILIVLFGLSFLGSRWLLTKNFPWLLWYALAGTAIILLSPRTESATYVVLAPAYLFLERSFSTQSFSPKFKAAFIFFYICGTFLTTIYYSDFWPRSLFTLSSFYYGPKIFGALGLWMCAFLMTARLIVNKINLRRVRSLGT